MIGLNGNLPGLVTTVVDGLINPRGPDEKRGGDRDRTTGGRGPADRTGTGNTDNTGNTNNTGKPNNTGNTNNGNNNGIGNNGNNGNNAGNNNGIGNQYGNGNGRPDLGGNQRPSVVGDTLSSVHQLGNSLFGANAMRPAPGMQASPAAAYSGNANPQAAAQAQQTAGPPQYSQASQAAYYGQGAKADARTQFAAMPVSVLNANATLASARTGAPITAFAGSGAMAAASGSGPAATTTAAAATTMAQQPTGPATAARADAAQLAAQTPPGSTQMAARADAAVLAAARAAALATAAAAPGTLAQAATLTPAGNPLALAAPGLTVATVPTNPAADARGVILPTHDAATSQRAENAMNPAGHTLAGAQRRQRGRGMSSMPQGGLARLLWAVGAAGYTSEGSEDGAEREVRRAMQWLFWILTLIAYGCLAGALVVFVGSDGRLADSMADRNSTAALAMCGLAAGVIAWGVARWMSSRRH